MDLMLSKDPASFSGTRMLPGLFHVEVLRAFPTVRRSQGRTQKTPEEFFIVSGLGACWDPQQVLEELV